MSENKMQHVAICGAGVIGSAIAYYLSKRGVRSTIIEAHHVACGASGKAGGFLAKYWSEETSMALLARKSFELHSELGRILDASQTGYRKLHTIGLDVEENSDNEDDSSTTSSSSSSRSTTGKHKPPTKPKARKSVCSAEEEKWLDSPLIKRSRRMGSEETTAQVHPFHFTKALIKAAAARVVHGEAEGVVLEDGKEGQQRVKGVRVKLSEDVKEGKTGEDIVIEADAVVVAMGPWTSKAATWFDGNEKYRPSAARKQLSQVTGQRAHSIVLKPSQPELPTPTAVFLDYTTADGDSMDPEIYPRPDGTVYLCGMTDEEELPSHPSQVTPNPNSISVLRRVASNVSSLLDVPVEAEQACFLPSSSHGRPLLGKLPGLNNAFVAAGHTCWGILLAPVTGLVMSELIVDGESKSLDIGAFDVGQK